MSSRHALRSSIVALALTAWLGCADKGGTMLPFPGGALIGRVSSETVYSWAFVKDGPLRIEVNPAHPHSLNVDCVVDAGRLYVHGEAGAHWLEAVRADPRVRVLVDETIYSARAVPIGDPGVAQGFAPGRVVYRLDGVDPSS